MTADKTINKNAWQKLTIISKLYIHFSKSGSRRQLRDKMTSHAWHTKWLHHHKVITLWDHTQGPD